MPAGNRSVLVILDSRRKPERAMADRTVFAAVEHFGVAWEALECGCYMAIPPGHVTPRAVYILAHDGVGAGLNPEVAAEIVENVRAGAGLISFDREVGAWPAPLRGLLDAEPGTATAETLRFPNPEGFITFGHPTDEEIALDAPVTVTTLPVQAPWEALLATAAGDCVAAQRKVDQGRVVVFGCGERLWAEEVYGHVRGVDGLMWRALVWAAPKPFPMRCVPPFVSARMDDCNGTYGAFGYVDIMNKYGIKPNLGLFIDEMGPTDWAAASRLYREEKADFSMHAFRDDYYRARPDYKPYAVLPDKPDLSNGGKETVFEGLSMDHETGRDLDAATVLRNFQRMDDAFRAAGIRHSRVLNAHFGEIGWRAVPLFLQRGVDMPCNNAVVGQLYSNQPPWRPRPYGIRGITGRHGFVMERCPRNSGFTFINMSVGHLAKSHMGSDILSGRVPYLGEAPYPKLDEATAAGLFNVKLALDALAFGLIMTHEERIDAISPEDWNTVITGIVRGLEGWDLEYTGREHISVVCKRLLDSRLVYAEVTEAGMHCELSGRTVGPSPLTIWEDDGDGCVRRTVEVGPVEGFAEVKV